MKKTLKTLTVLSLAFGGYVLGKGITQGIAAAQPTAEAIVSAEFRDEPLRSMSTAMFTWFPAEATAMRDAMIRVAESGDLSIEGLRAAVLPVTGPVHALVSGVPDAGLVAILEGHIALYSQLAPEPLVCAELAVHGATRDTLAHPQMAGFDLQGHFADYFAILDSARYATAGAPATETDLDALGAAMTAAGLGDEVLGALDASRADDPRLCGAVIALLEVVRDADFPGAERIRRDFLVGMASG